MANEEEHSNDDDDTSSSCWIGVDFGTTHSSVAVYDATRGHAKWMRLPSATPNNADSSSSKWGRQVPSQVLIMRKDKPSSTVLYHVGHKVQTMLHHPEQYCPEDPLRVEQASVTSLKRYFATQTTLSRIPLDHTNHNNKNTPQEYPCQDLVSIVLERLRHDANVYLQSPRTQKKNLQTPGRGPPCLNVVLGVPAHYSITQRHQMKQAARQAGFTGHVSTLTESTAAALAYGMFVMGPTTMTFRSKTILVLDIGGGTTDVTLATLASSSGGANSDENITTTTTTTSPGNRFQVLATQGDGLLGGDNLDRLLLEQVQSQLSSSTTVVAPLSVEDERKLLRLCQRAKEELSTHTTTQIVWQNHTIPLSRNEFEQRMEPLLQRVEQVIDRTLNCLVEDKTDTPTTTTMMMIDEVILIGGSTRVPKLRQWLQTTKFPHVELATSISPLSAVALGCAIQAAYCSNTIPHYELESALMLDTIPYPIGVLLGQRHRGKARDIVHSNDNNNDDDAFFVEILSAGRQLPASSYQTFALHDPQQGGITVLAVERVDQDGTFVVLEEFTFWLHRDRLTRCLKERTVDIGMTLSLDGAISVEIFDVHDPEHIRKRARAQQKKQDNHETHPAVQGAGKRLDFVTDNSIPWNQIMLGIACFILFGLYIAIKLLFPDEMLVHSRETTNNEL